MKFIRDIINEKSRASGRADKPDLHFPLRLRQEERADLDGEDNLFAEVAEEEGGLETGDVQEGVAALFAEEEGEDALPETIEPAPDTTHWETSPGIEPEAVSPRDSDMRTAVAPDPEPEAVFESARARGEEAPLGDDQPAPDLNETWRAPEPSQPVHHAVEAPRSGENADGAASEMARPEADLGDWRAAGTPLNELVASDAVAEPEPMAEKDDPGADADLSAMPVVAPDAVPSLPSSVSTHKPASGRGFRGRVKTRLLGFSAPQDAARDPLDRSSAAMSGSFAKFPVGWLVVIDGPGKGAAFPLFDGLTQIGRGESQGVCLDFGDNSISRENHAAIAYDDEQRRFFFGHGGKANLVRLNGRPILSTEVLETDSVMRIGETTLRFVALCGEDFSWRGEEKDDARHAKFG